MGSNSGIHSEGEQGDGREEKNKGQKRQGETIGSDSEEDGTLFCTKITGRMEEEFERATLYTSCVMIGQGMAFEEVAM